MLYEQQFYLFGQIQNQSNRRSAVQWNFPYGECSLYGKEDRIREQ